MGDYGVGTQNPFNLLDDDDNEPQAQEHEEARGGKAPKAHSKTATKTGQQEVASRKKETAPAEPAKPRKREFDRHSGTGRGKEVQKGGKGKFNWGSNEEPADAGAEVAAPVEAVAEAEVAAPVEPEKEDLGYEDYLAQLAQKRPEDDLKVQVREAIVDNKQFKAGKALEAQEEEPLFAELVQQKSKAKKEKKAKAAVSLDEFVAKNGGPIVREHRDFGEGGRGRGGRGRGGFRGGRGRGGFGGAPSDGAAAPAPVDGAAPAPADGAAPAPGDQGFRGGRGGRGRGGFRGGRGGERGGFRGESRGRGGFRGGRGGRGGQGGNQGQPIDVSDDSLFPALKKQ